MKTRKYMTRNGFLYFVESVLERNERNFVSQSGNFPCHSHMNAVYGLSIELLIEVNYISAAEQIRWEKHQNLQAEK